MVDDIPSTPKYGARAEWLVARRVFLTPGHGWLRFSLTELNFVVEAQLSSHLGLSRRRTASVSS